MLRTSIVLCTLCAGSEALAMDRAELDHVGAFNFTVEVGGVTADSLLGVEMLSGASIGADILGPEITYDAPLSLSGILKSEFGGPATLDLSNVRIVTDTEDGTSSIIADAALMVGAEAFATADDVVFVSAGAVDTMMVGHEAAHVAQQRSGFTPAGSSPRGGAGVVWFLEPGSVLTVRVVPAPASVLAPLALLAWRRRR